MMIRDSQINMARFDRHAVDGRMHGQGAGRGSDGRQDADASGRHVQNDEHDSRKIRRKDAKNLQGGSRTRGSADDDDVAIIHEPGLTAALWRHTLINAAMFREWMIEIGRRSAYQRIAYLSCELQRCLKAVGLSGENGYDLPVTQNELADALGLRATHVNRMLQDLRSERLIALCRGTLHIPDWKAFQAAGDFDPAYLHIRT
jgi:Crp-like helix-turn-helix protein